MNKANLASRGAISAAILIITASLFTMCGGVGTGDSGSPVLPPALPEFSLYLKVNQTINLSPDEIERTASVPDSEGNITLDDGTIIANIAEGTITGIAEGAKILPLLNLIICVTPETPEIPEVIATPTATPPRGKVDSGTPIILFCSTPEAKIYYTIDGSDPTTENWILYSDGNEPVITEATTLKAIAVKEGLENSLKLATAYYVSSEEGPIQTPPPSPEQVAIPEATPAVGEVAYGAKITLSSSPSDAHIYYTTNGDIPSSESEEYSPTNQPTITEATTLNAIAIKNGMINSTIMSTAYYIAPETLPIQKVGTPTANPPAGEVNSGTKITFLTSTTEAVIYYTTGTGTPDILYSVDTDIIITEPTTFKAIAVKPGMTASDEMSVSYTVPAVSSVDPFRPSNDTSTSTLNLMDVFQVQGTDKVAVDATFKRVSAFVKSARTKTDIIKGIHLGDYIDLPSLNVDAYQGSGAIEVANAALDGNKGAKLRVIVVGINSFNSGDSTNGKYNTVLSDIQAYNDATPHIVFQFQNLPGTMNMGSNNAGGYAASLMRKYLVKVDSVGGNFLTALTTKNAGVPVSVLWAPQRSMAINYDDNGSAACTVIQDFLWLPTERELHGTNLNMQFSTPSETEANQTRLEYYADNAKRIKYNMSGEASYWWEASPCPYTTSVSCATHTDGFPNYYGADMLLGVAPAFCVK